MAIALSNNGLRNLNNNVVKLVGDIGIKEITIPLVISDLLILDSPNTSFESINDPVTSEVYSPLFTFLTDTMEVGSKNIIGLFFNLIWSAYVALPCTPVPTAGSGTGRVKWRVGASDFPTSYTDLTDAMPIAQLNTDFIRSGGYIRYDDTERMPFTLELVGELDDASSYVIQSSISSHSYVKVLYWVGS